MERRIEETPAAIVVNGEIKKGIFASPFRNLNLNEAAPTGGFWRRMVWKTRLKEWLGFGIEHPDWYLSVFMQDAKYVGSGSFMAFDRRNKGLLTYECSGLSGTAKMATSFYGSESVCEKKNFKMKYFHNLDESEHRIVIEAAGTRHKPSVSVDMRLSEDCGKLQPLLASIPLRGGCSIFTHKAPMPAAGRFRIGNEEFELDGSRDLAIMDEHKSYLPRKTVWRWATFAGYDANGRLIGANLGDHDTIDEQAYWNENCLWIGDKMPLLGEVKFEFDRVKHTDPWKIKETNGRADLTFYPDGDKVKNLHLGVMGMKYFQPCGRFRGYIVGDDGEQIEIDNMYGVAEMMDARW